MTKHLLLITAAVGLSGCANYVYDGRSDRSGLGAVNVPVVSQTSFAMDVAAPGGVLPSTETARLKGWFESMGLQYGDLVYVDGNPSARSGVAAVAGEYGLLLADGAPVTEGNIAPGSARVVVVRSVASVPSCPNWREDAFNNPQNVALPGYGCGVNGNLAAMIANPNDLVYGREGNGLVDTRRAQSVIQTYRDSGAGGE
ncbi:CpaD family pilus assembly lipoprotein [Sphingomicrobium sp. XHP0239]|uniref:CpaD family pilus assembly lipoprotein n=1 Tax=Sphingomicrobium maritimum TaxID=3133972 RepID=UPI0031CC7C4E